MKKEYIIPYLKSAIGLIIIIGVIWIVVVYARKGYEEEKIETLKTDMLSLSGKIAMIEEKKIMKEKGAKYKGTKASDMKEDPEVKKMIENKTINLKSKNNNYYVITKENLSELELPEIELENGYYIVDYTTSEVIYTIGVTDEQGNTLYKLSDIKEIGNEQKLDKTEQKEEKQDKEEDQEKENKEKEEDKEEKEDE